VLISNLIGTVAPLLIHRMGFDPTVMSAPLMATVIDVCGLTIYFETARYLLKL
jgi:magnesium transporter